MSLGDPRDRKYLSFYDVILAVVIGSALHSCGRTLLNAIWEAASK